MSRFKDFTDLEVYVLSRQAIESSYEITMSGEYNQDEGRVHESLMNELIVERRERGI